MLSEVASKSVEAAKEAVEVKEAALKEIPEGTQILQPNMETIKTQSLESVKQSNMESYEAGEVTNTEVNVQEVTNVDEYRPLTEEEIKIIQNETSMSEATLKDCVINNEGTIKLNCINEYKVGMPSEVPYVNYTVTINSYEIKVVMPEFPDVFYEIKIPEGLYLEDDYTVFKYCTEELKNAIIANPELGKQFSQEQLDQIMSGAPRIKGLTWHHGAECGSMQLVSTKMHSEYRHTGGKAIWGGGRT